MRSCNQRTAHATVKVQGSPKWLNKKNVKSEFTSRRLWPVSSQQFYTRVFSQLSDTSMIYDKTEVSPPSSEFCNWHDTVPHLLTLHLFTHVTSIFRDRSEDLIIPLNRWGHWGPSVNDHPPAPKPSYVNEEAGSKVSGVLWVCVFPLLHHAGLLICVYSCVFLEIDFLWQKYIWGHL